MKKWYKICPYCANEIKEAAIKCQYCWEFLKKNEKMKENSKQIWKTKKECPFCLNKIEEDMKECPFCEEKIDGKTEEDEECDKNISDENKETLKPDEKWIYHCPDCWKVANRWYLECENCWAKLKWLEEDISFAKNLAQENAEKRMIFSFIATIIIILIYLWIILNPEIVKFTILAWNEDVRFTLWFAVFFFSIISICMILFKNRVAFTIMFLDYLFSFIAKLIAWNLNMKSTIFFSIILIYIFFRWMYGSFVYRSLMWKKKLSVDEWILLLVWCIVVLFIVIWFNVD